MSGRRQSSRRSTRRSTATKTYAEPASDDEDINVLLSDDSEVDSDNESVKEVSPKKTPKSTAKKRGRPKLKKDSSKKKNSKRPKIHLKSSSDDNFEPGNEEEEGEDDDEVIEIEDDDSSIEEIAPRRKRGRPKKGTSPKRSSNSGRDYGPMSERTCPFCKKVFSIVTGLAYHLEHKVCQNNKSSSGRRSICGSIPFPRLKPGEKFETQYGIVKVIKDDRGDKDCHKAKISADFVKTNKRYKSRISKHNIKKEKVHLFVAQEERRRRQDLINHYKKFDKSHLSGTPKKEFATGIWKHYYPHATVDEVLSGIYTKSTKPALQAVEFSNSGENPAEPDASCPNRMVECILVKDERRILYDFDEEGDTRFSKINYALEIVKKSQKSKGRDKSSDDSDKDVHECGLKIFIKRRELGQIYDGNLTRWCCSKCGKTFVSQAGVRSHVASKSCENDKEGFRERREERLIEVDNAITEEGFKAPPWILPPLKAQPGEKKRKRSKQLPGWLQFHPAKSSIYPSVFKFLKLKRGSNNSKFMLKKWDDIGPGRKRQRKSRAKKKTAQAIVSEVNQMFDISKEAIYPGVKEVLFPDVDNLAKRESSSRAASKAASRKVSQMIDSIDIKEEYNDFDNGDDDGDFMPQEFDIDSPLPPLPMAMPQLPTVKMPPAISNSIQLNENHHQPINVSGKPVAKPNPIETTAKASQPPKRVRRRRRTESASNSVAVKPAAPIIVDMRPLVEEVRGGRYPSMKVYNGERLNICFHCKTESDDVLDCEFCVNSEHLECLKSKVNIREPEVDDAFMCHRCLQTVISRRVRAEKRRIEKLNEATKKKEKLGESLAQAKDAAKLKREVTWSQTEFDNYIISYNKCPTGGPGGLICCGACTANYSKLLSDTAKEMEVQTVSGVGREVSELLELLHDAQVRLQQAVDVTNTNSVRRSMIRDGPEDDDDTVQDRNAGFSIMDIFNGGKK